MIFNLKLILCGLIWSKVIYDWTYLWAVFVIINIYRYQKTPAYSVLFMASEC